MQTDNSKGVRTLWGHEFHVIPDGLAEPDVVAFVEELMGQYRATLEKDKHVVALRQHAVRTVEEAESLAKEIREQAETQSQDSSESPPPSYQYQNRGEAGQILGPKLML